MNLVTLFIKYGVTIFIPFVRFITSIYYFLLPKTKKTSKHACCITTFYSADFNILYIFIYTYIFSCDKITYNYLHGLQITDDLFSSLQKPLELLRAHARHQGDFKENPGGKRSRVMNNMRRNPHRHANCHLWHQI